MTTGDDAASALAHRRLAEAIVSLASARNREARGEATLTLVFGAGWTLLLGLLILGLSYVALFLLGRGIGIPPGLGAFGFTAVILLAGTWGAWRGHEPLGAIDALSDAEFDAMLLRQAAGLHTGADLRRALAGFADVLIAGPRQVIEGWSELRDRLPEDAATVGTAAALLAAALASGRLSLDALPRDATTRASAVLLGRLGLLVAGPRAQVERHLVPTGKAEAIRDAVPRRAARPT